MKNGPYTPNFEGAVREALIAQLTSDEVLGALTKAVMSRLDEAEDNRLLDILKQETDTQSVPAEAFLASIKS